MILFLLVLVLSWLLNAFSLLLLDFSCWFIVFNNINNRFNHFILFFQTYLFVLCLFHSLQLFLLHHFIISLFNSLFNFRLFSYLGLFFLSFLEIVLTITFVIILLHLVYLLFFVLFYFFSFLLNHFVLFLLIFYCLFLRNTLVLSYLANQHTKHVPDFIVLKLHWHKVILLIQQQTQHPFVLDHDHTLGVPAFIATL